MMNPIAIPMDPSMMQNQGNMNLQSHANMHRMQQQMSLMADGRMLNPGQRQMMMQGQLPPTPPAVPNSFQQGGASMGQPKQWGSA
eukprot:15497549-Heterocapsa_arctica.AAC.1